MGGGEQRPAGSPGRDYEPREPPDEADTYGRDSEDGESEEPMTDDETAGASGGGAEDGAGNEQQQLSAYGGGLPGGVNPVTDEVPGDVEVGPSGQHAARMASYVALFGVVRGVAGIDEETEVDDAVIESLERVHDEALAE